MNVLLRIFGMKDEPRPDLMAHLRALYIEDKLTVEEYERNVDAVLHGAPPGVPLNALSYDYRFPEGAA